MVSRDAKGDGELGVRLPLREESNCEATRGELVEASGFCMVPVSTCDADI